MYEPQFSDIVSVQQHPVIIHGRGNPHGCQQPRAIAATAASRRDDSEVALVNRRIHARMRADDVHGSLGVTAADRGPRADG